MTADGFGVVRFLLVTVCTIMACVGTARPQFSGNNTEFFFDRIRTDLSASTGYGDLPCTAFGDNMRAAYAMAIMACIALAITALCELLLLLSYLLVPLKNHRRPIAIGALVLALLAFSLLLISWALSEHGRVGRFCGSSSSLRDDGFKIQEGLGLLIAAWCLMFIEIVVAILVFVGYIGKGTALNEKRL